jgi:hypothetical protein
MLSQVSQSITFVAHFRKAGVGTVPSSAPTVSIERKGSGSLLASGGTTVAGLLAGVYYYTLSSGSDAIADSYVAVFSTSDATMDQQDVPALWVVGNSLAAALPATAPGADGGLPTIGTGSGQIAVNYGRVPATVAPADVSGPLPADVQSCEVEVSANVTDWSYAAAPDLPDAVSAILTNLDVKVSGRAGPGDPMALTSGERASLAGAIWGTLTSALTTANSIGKKLAALVLGSDNKVMVSSDSGAVPDGPTDAKLAGMLVGSIPDKFTAPALSNAPAGSGGGGGDPLGNPVPGTYAAGTAGYAIAQAATRTVVQVTPAQANVANPRFATRDLSPIAQGSAPADQWTIQDGQGNPIDLSAKLLRFVVYTAAEADGSDDPFTLTPRWKYETGGGITVGGRGNNVVTVQQSAANNGTAGHYLYWLLNVTDRLPLANGRLPIKPALWDV